jgi:hypothetical protein
MTDPSPGVEPRDIGPLLCCPTCQGALGEDACSACGRRFWRAGRQVRFVDAPIDTTDAAFQNETQNRTNLTGWLFSAGGP